jgi:hypothetical protein
MTDRLAECPDDDACSLSRIEVDFAMPVYLTRAHQRELLDLLSAIVDLPCNQLAEGVHWVASVGSRPRWSQADAAFLGEQAEPDAPASGEPTFDDEVFHVSSSAREFGSEKERERVARRRAREERAEQDRAAFLKMDRLSIAHEAILRERLAGPLPERDELPAHTARLLLREVDELRARLARANVCEACGDVLVPERPRCERHVHTEPGDPEWTMEEP